MVTRRGFKAVVTILAAVVLMAGCSPAASDTPDTDSTADAGNGSATLKIGATFPILDQFLQNVADGMKEEADALGVNLTVVAAQEKTDVQLGQIENFIADGVDAILVVPVDTDAAGPMTAAAVAAGIPLVYINRRPSDLPAGVPYVGSDSIVAGQLQMTALAELVGGEGNVVILQGDPANEAAIMRTKGCQEIVDANPGMTVTKTQAGNWYREEGLAIVENWLQSGDTFDVICANNDEMALGAIQALKNANLLDDVVVGGVDATSDALAAMEAGELEVTVFQDAAGQGGGGVAAAVQLINGETVEDIVDIPYLLVTPENLADFT